MSEQHWSCLPKLRFYLDALATIADRGLLESYPFYPATLGEMHMRLGQFEVAAPYFARAIALTSSPAEQHFLQQKLSACLRVPDRASHGKIHERYCP